MKFLLSILFILALNPASAASIQDVFGEGVFGIKWGDSLESIKNKYPKVERKELGEIVWLELEDSREVLGIKRQDQKLHFSFDSENRLIGVAVYFDQDDYTTALSKLNTLFGEYEKIDGNYMVIQWKAKELVLSLNMVPNGFGVDTLFSIGYYGLSKPDASKESLGFN
jgi:uncharacterized protein YuzE